MKKEIKLFNRDGANLKLVNTADDIWELKVDKKHEYVLRYIRIIFKEHSETLNPKNYLSVDPSGGPFITLGDIFEEYKLVEFINSTTFIMEYEGDNN